MKKSTKYLLFLIGAFFLAAILYPIILHYVPQEKLYDDEVIEEIPVDYSQREVPIVDMPVAAIDLSESFKASTVIIEGVESLKDQIVEIKVAADEKYINAINVDHNAGTSTLKVTDKISEGEKIDSLLIRIAVPADGRLDVVTDNCHSVTFRNINTETLELTSKHTTTADCVDLNLESCNINNFNFIALVYGQKFYLNCMGSAIGSLSISTVRNFNLNANGNVRNLALNAEANIEVSLTGYDGDIDLNKNNHKVYIDR